MPRTKGSTAENQRDGIAEALRLLELGFLPRQVVARLVGSRGISESTARRYCRQAESELAQDLADFDAPREMQRLFQQQRLQANLAAQAGDADAAIKWSNAARSTLSQLMRLDPLSSPAAWERTSTVAAVEPLSPPSESQRRKYRRSISDLPPDYPH